MKLKFEPYDYASINSGAVKLDLVGETSCGEDIYQVGLILWLSEKDIPIIIDTEIFDTSAETALILGVDFLSKLTSDILDEVYVFAPNKETKCMDKIGELSVADYFPEQDDEDVDSDEDDENSCENCSSCK